MAVNKIICLMGPTASGKTALAVRLAQHFPCEIISVDSAMVYRGMDIGTAKPDAETLTIAPHRLIDVVDPAASYSAGQFRQDALREIDDILARGKVPLLVGGTMMYFRVLQQGIADLPPANPAIRAMLQSRADAAGWESLHAALAQVDALAAQRINPNDSQRIQRALEVYRLTGKPISLLQAEETNPLADYQWLNAALMPSDRALLHARIAKRFDQMLAGGFIDEVRRLYLRGDLSPDSPAVRSVGYREVWAYLAGDLSYDLMREQAIASTRQLAKRQMTWLRSWPFAVYLDSEAADLFEITAKLLEQHGVMPL